MLDRELLDALTEGDEAFARELVSTYLRSSRRIVEEIAKSLDSATLFTSHAHALKGAGNSVGLIEVAALAARYESLGKQNPDSQTMAAALEELRRETQRGEAALEEYLRDAFG